MADPKITDMQRKMEAAFGHRVTVLLKHGNKSFAGKCVCFTPSWDNDPEAASIDIDMGIPTSVTELMEDEIESITILD